MKYPKEKQSALLERFDRLQRKLSPLWKQIGRSDPGSLDLEEENTVVVLPSLTVDIKLEMHARQAYEERMLFMIFLLRQPYIRLIYLTSVPIPQEIIDYYLHILPSVSVSSARRRLFLISTQDASSGPLSKKILERPRLIEQVRSLIPDINKAHLVPFVTTDLERDIAVQLGIPMYAADPRYFAFGTKSGCRRIFEEEGVSHPLGAENLYSKEDLIGAIRRMRQKKPNIGKIIIKHNEGVSGYGNATLDLSGLPAPNTSKEADNLGKRLEEMNFEQKDVEYDWYMEQFSKGGVVEELISGEEMTSPSAQLRISPLGEVELLSTHDQILGGPGGQTYLGARFPANPEYGPLIISEAEKVAKRFAREGIVGRFAIDFIVVRSGKGTWQTYAIEVNLRKGGTTHPFLTLQYLTDGNYDTKSGIFRTERGHAKYYVATDNLKSPAYKTLTPEDLFDLVSINRLHFDHTKQTGIVLHMLSGIASSGRFGLTAIGDTPQHADAIYDRFTELIDKNAGKS